MSNFKSENQRKFVMSKLKKRGFDGGKRRRYVLDMADQVRDDENKSLTPTRLKEAIDEDYSVDLPLTDAKKFIDDTKKECF